MKWTPRQKEVIDARGSNLLVSAAAGSGKTAVLVERIINLICDEEHPVDIDHLLVMTFTNAAAAEMRERISQAIERKLEEEPGRAHLQIQAALVHRAQITTIDSFCLSLIRDHFNLLDMDPGFRIGDEIRCSRSLWRPTLRANPTVVLTIISCGCTHFPRAIPSPRSG